MNSTKIKNADFPLWWPSALVKELRQGLRTPLFIGALCAAPIILSIIFLFSFIEIKPNKGLMDPEVCNVVLWGLLVVSTCVLIPIRALGSVTAELTSKNIELLLLTRQTSFRIVTGKWFSFMLQTLLMISITLPFIFIRYFYGDVNLLSDMISILLLFGCSAILTAFGLWFSGFGGILKTLFSLSVFSCIFGVTFLITEGANELADELGNGTWDGILFFFYIGLCVFIISYIFITFARRWFAPASENTFFQARKLMLPIVFIALLVQFFTLDTSFDDFSMAITGISLWIAAFIAFIDMNTPSYLMPVHLTQKYVAKVPGFLKSLLLPGFPSAAYYLAVVGVMFGLYAYILIDLDGSHGAEYSIMYYCALAISAWYMMMVPALMIKMFWKNLKGSAPIIIYVAISGALSFFIGIMEIIEFYIPFIPGASFVGLMSCSDNLTHWHEMGGYLIIASLMELVIGVVLLKSLNGEWYKVRKASKAPQLSIEESN